MWNRRNLSDLQNESYSLIVNAGMAKVVLMCIDDIFVVNPTSGHYIKICDEKSHKD